MKTIVVCCGSSMITSSVANKKITEYLNAQGIKVKMIQCKFAEVAGNVDLYHPDLIIPTGALKPEIAKGVPVIKGTCFVTGIGEKETLEKMRLHQEVWAGMSL
jgi:PTS system galactitol-specific IIB component